MGSVYFSYSSLTELSEKYCRFIYAGVSNAVVEPKFGAIKSAIHYQFSLVIIVK